MTDSFCPGSGGLEVRGKISQSRKFLNPITACMEYLATLGG